MDDDLLTLSQVARMLDISETTARRWADAGRLPAVRVAKTRWRLVPRRAVEALAAEHQQQRQTARRATAQ